MSPRDRARTVVESTPFQWSITGVIMLNAAVLGLETSPDVSASAHDVLQAVDRSVLAVFVVEIGLRLYAHRLRFFRDPWSVFDFLVVGMALVPASPALAVLRALRILRALRLVSTVPGMRRVVGGLLAAMPGMASIILLLCLVLYLGSVLATELYGSTAPQHFGNLGDSLFTLFQVMTGEAWPDIAADVLPHHPTAWMFFVLYILVSTFIVLNLFTAVVVSAMEPERAAEATVDARVLAELAALRAEIRALRADRGMAGSGQASGVQRGGPAAAAGPGGGA